MSGTPVLSDALRRRLEQLSPERRALLERQLAERAAAEPPIRRRGADGPSVLSSGQEFLWRLDQVLPDLVAYNVPRLLRISGELDVDALRQSLDWVVARHEMLRTRFLDTAGGARQVVDPPRPVPFEVVEVDGPPETREARADAILLPRARYRFDLTRDLQLRATLVRLTATEHRLLLVSHHIACDEASRDVLFRELGVAYRALRSGVAPTLPPLPIQYADYAVWQRDALARGALAPQLAYWRDRLEGLPLLQLPTDHPGQSTPDFAGARRRHVMPTALLTSLRELGRNHDATLFMTLLAAYQVLLFRYSGQADVAVGVPATGRRRVELEELIGYFPSLLVLRASMHGDPTFTEFLGRVRESCLGAFEHQDVPLEELEQGAAGSPYQTFFSLQGSEADPPDLGAATVTVEPTDFRTAKLDLAIGFAERTDGLHVSVEYRTAMFEPATVDRMVGSLRAILDAVVGDPDVAVSRIPMLAAEERYRLLSVWGAATAPYPSDRCVHDCVREQADQTPDAIALETSERRMTFRELDRSANRVAQLLRSMGVGRGVGVGVCLERSPELIVGLLGVLKAGGHYVPLATDYPPERIAFMCQDAELDVILAGPSQRLPAGARIVYLDPALAACAGFSDDAPACDASPESPAYVIYTSGSTGRPKGVVVPHRAVVNYVHWMRTAFPHGDGDAILQKAPVSFDASVWELYLPLFTGARMVLARPDGAADPGYLMAVLQRHDITTVQFVPSQLHAVLDVGGLERCNRLRRLFCGGEALPAEVMQRAADALPEVELTNLYGPTETTVYSTSWTLDRSRIDGSAPIGRPIANTRLYVLDAAGGLAPVGVAGELHIGGTGVALGYLGRPQLTAERFVLDIFAGGETRMYRTGDLVRWRPDGVLEYLGRIDSQVKLRGHRIEPGEIEAVLNQHPAVSAAAVLVREDTPGDKRLVAYVVPSGAGDVTGATLRDHVRTALPEIMVPSTVVALDRLPLNANGKLDRAALPAPDASQLVASRYVAPGSDTERALAELWSGVLGIARVGAADSFVELGGHSLLAMRLLGLIRRQLGVLVSLVDLLRGATVAELAATIDELRAAGSEADDEPALVPVAREAFRPIRTGPP